MFNTPMFSALESTWNHSARRRWATLASITMQAFGLSLLLLIPMLTIQGPPMLRWLELPILAPPPAPAPSMHYERAPRFRRSRLDVAPPPLRCAVQGFAPLRRR